MSEDIKIGETRTVFPPEGMASVRVQGVTINAQGTPMEVTENLLTLHESGMIRLSDAEGKVSASDQPQENVAAQATEQPTQPDQPKTEAPVADTGPTPPEGANVQNKQLPTADDIDRMTDVQLKEFLVSVGHETQGRKRQFLVRTAKAYIENVSK